jgi:hypothetical protein
MGKKSSVELPAFLKEIIAIAESGDFDLSDLSDHPDIDGGEVIIGEMTPFEKAACMVSSRLVDEHNNLVRAIQRGEKPDDQETDIVLDTQKSVIKTIYDLLWISVKGRDIVTGYLGNPDWGGFGLREGGQIVAEPKRETTLGIRIVCGSGLAKFIGALGGAPTDNHDCADCAVYDECDQPMKQPR